MLNINLLGRFEIFLDGQPVDISSRPGQSLLAYLLRNPNRPLRREKLAGMFWPEANDASARSNLRHVLWRIRKVLEKEGESVYVETDDRDVTFRLRNEDYLDVGILEESPDSANLVEGLQRQVRVYQGELLPGFYEDWVILERERLQSIFDQKMQLLVETLAWQKKWEDVITWARLWIEHSHAPEPAYRILMLAHAAQGDIAAAAAGYQRCVAVLHQELGIEPSSQTEMAYQALVRGDQPAEVLRSFSHPRQHIPGPSEDEVSVPGDQASEEEFVNLAASEDVPRRASMAISRLALPSPVTSLIGRHDDITAVLGYLMKENIRLVTLIGPPGIGKTRLSLAAAREACDDFCDGVFFVALAPLNDPSLVAATFVQALGFVETSIASPLERLKEGIGDKQMLLVIDNVEHLIESAALLVSELLSACPALKILTTSREALRVQGEWLYSVRVLDIPSANQLQSMSLETAGDYSALNLFTERARAVRPDFFLNADNLKTVAAICAQLDGLPLAIELIAARIRLVSPKDLLSRLVDGFALLADGMRALPARQRTLYNAIAWSYNLLSQEEQRLFAYLSVFSGGFRLDVAEQVFSTSLPNKPITDLIASLLDKSLLQSTNEVADELRFSMLVTIQQFAANRLHDFGEEDVSRERHLAYFLDLAEQADREIHGPDQVIWLKRLKAEHENFRAALEWCVSKRKTEAALRLLCALAWPWWLRGHSVEVRIWFDKLRGMPEITRYRALYARMLNHLGQQNWVLGNFSYARSVLEESRSIWSKLGVEGEQGLAESLNYLGMVAQSGEVDRQKAHYFFELSLELCQKSGNLRGKAAAMFNLGRIAIGMNQDASALSWYEQSLEIYRQLGDEWGIARISQLLGDLYLKQGDFEKALHYFGQHLKHDEALGFNQGIMVALSSYGDLYRCQGNFDKAEQFYDKSLAAAREYDQKWTVSNNLYFLGMVALHRNDYPIAKQYFIDCFDLARNIYEKMGAIDLFIGLSAVAAGMSQPERAAKLSGAAHAMLEAIDYQISPFDQAEFDRHIDIARQQLGAQAFEALADESRAMTIEQAVAYALS